MAFRPLKSFFPTADELLQQGLPVLGGVLLAHLKSYQGLNTVYQHAGLHRGYFRAMLENRNVGLGPLPKEPEYGARQPEVTKRMMEAWGWLERKGILIRNDQQVVADWFIISSDGEKYLDQEKPAAPPSPNNEICPIPNFEKAAVIDNQKANADTDIRGTVPAMPTMDAPRAFLSYSWEGQEHRQWVTKLAERLLENGVDVRFDQWHLNAGSDTLYFMEHEVTLSNFVIVVCTPTYAERANQREGGVGYESMVITAELAHRLLTNKFIPVLREGAWASALPTYLRSKLGVNLSDEPFQEDQYEKLLRALHGEPIQQPPLGNKPDFSRRAFITNREFKDTLPKPPAFAAKPSVEGSKARFRLPNEPLGVIEDVESKLLHKPPRKVQFKIGSIDLETLKYAQSLYDRRFKGQIRPDYQNRLAEAIAKWNPSPSLIFSGSQAKVFIEVEAHFAGEAAIAKAESIIEALEWARTPFDNNAYRKCLDDIDRLLKNYGTYSYRKVIGHFNFATINATSQKAVDQGFKNRMAQVHDRIVGRLDLELHKSRAMTRLEQYRGSKAESEDRKFMRLAIEEARKSIPEDAKPHPKVGAVVVKNGKVLSRAHRGEVLGNHAEFIALDRKLSDETLAGATVYTTLEPCTARNSPKIPCVQRIIDRKIARVFIGMLDPDPRIIKGGSMHELKDAKIEVAFFPNDLKEEIEELNRDFKRLHKPQRETVASAGRIAIPGTIKIVGAVRTRWILAGLGLLSFLILWTTVKKGDKAWTSFLQHNDPTLTHEAVFRDLSARVEMPSNNRPLESTFIVTNGSNETLDSHLMACTINSSVNRSGHGVIKGMGPIFHVPPNPAGGPPRLSDYEVFPILPGGDSVSEPCVSIIRNGETACADVTVNFLYTIKGDIPKQGLMKRFRFVARTYPTTENEFKWHPQGVSSPKDFCADLIGDSSLTDKPSPSSNATSVQR